MKVFIIHRFKDRKGAKGYLKNLSQDLSLDFYPIFLDSSGGEQWKKKAVIAIDKSEAVIIFNPKSCDDSENAKWEIKKAKEAQKEIIELDNDSDNALSISKLKSLHELEVEFDSCFSPDNKDTIELYKMMVESSETLIQRRQKTSAFFITAIGSLLAIAGLLVKTGAINGKSTSILYGFSVVGLLL